MPTTASAQPCTRPTTNWTPTDNTLLDEFIEDADTATAIRLFLLRNTVGWNRLWYATTVAGLAENLGRSKAQVSKKLDELVARGRVLREKVKAGFYKLALAEPKQAEEDCENPSSEAVENSKPKQTGQKHLSRKRDGKCLENETNSSRKRDTSDRQVPGNHSGTGLSKQRQTYKDKQSPLLKPSPAPAATVENSPQTTPRWSHNPSLEQMIGEPECDPVRVKTLRGFPDREEVRFERRMDYEAFEELWHSKLNYKREHLALQAYVWHTFTREEAEYLIKACRHARNLYGYANKVVRAMEQGLSGPKRQ